MFPNEFYSGAADPAAQQRTQEYQSMMAGLDLVSGAPDWSQQPQGLAAQPTMAAGLDLVSGGLDLVSGADQYAELIASGAMHPSATRFLPPALQRAIAHRVGVARARQMTQIRQAANQPRIVDNGPTAYKEQTENLSRTAVIAGGEYAWTFTILGRAAKVVDLILPDSIAAFFDVLSALVGNNNMFHGGGAANGESFASSARRTGFESDTVSAGSLVTIRFKNQDAATHSISARAKLQVMY